MTRGLRNEAAVRRLFREHDMEVISIRRRKHWTIYAKPAGSENVTRFTISSSPSSGEIHQLIRGDLKRAGARGQPVNVAT